MKREKLMRGILTAAAVCMMAGFTMNVSAASERWQSSTSRDENRDICIEFTDVLVTLPADWSGRCQMGSSDTEVSFYHTKSRQLYTQEMGYACGGWLFSVCFSEDLSFLDNPSCEPLAQVSDGYYYMTFPTDVQGYVDDQTAMNEFSELASEVEWVADNTLVTRADAVPFDAAAAEYIFPQSSSSYMTEADLYGMTAQEVQMAINEIYARHGRKFVLDEVQAYFDSKSWYTGTIEAADFNVNVMNQYEGANMNLMVKYMKTAPASSDDIIVTVSDESSSTKDCYGMIIDSSSGYFRVRQQDGSVIQFWYDAGKLANMGIAESDLAVGATVSLMYTTDSYEAVSILVY